MKNITTTQAKPKTEPPKRPPRGFGLTDSRILTALGSLSAATRKGAVAAARNTVSDGTASLIDHHEHIADCINIDTIGLELKYAYVDLPRQFAPLNDDQAADQESKWGRGRTERESGKKTFRVFCRKLPKKQRVADAVTDSLIGIEGSPAYHFQGHNIVASSDVTMMAHDMVKAVWQQHKFELAGGRRLAIARGRDVEVTRLDIAILVKLPHDVEKAAVINAVALALAMNGSNMQVFSGESVYCDPSSQLRAWKLYDKEAELAYRKGFNVPNSDAGRALVDICENTLRLEFVFRRKYFASHAMFRGHPVCPQRFDRSLLALMVIEELARTKLFDKLSRRYGMDQLLGIPMPYRTTLALWQNGGEVRAVLGDEEAEAHRRFLRGRLEGLDIFKAAPAVLPSTLRFIDVLHPNNFVAVPSAVKADAKLFHASDMAAEVKRRVDEQGLRGVGNAPLNPYVDWDADRAEHVLTGNSDPDSEANNGSTNSAGGTV